MKNGRQTFLSGSRSQAVIGLIMGVAGVGKTTVGRAVAERLDWEFYDADDFHSDASVEKMREGIALTDADRVFWLEELRQLIERRLDEGRSAIVACSALKRSYRETLVNGHAGVVPIFLKAPPGVIRERIQSRSGHFFDPDLLDSQFATLEEPVRGVTIDASRPFEEVVDSVERVLGTAGGG